MAFRLFEANLVILAREEALKSEKAKLQQYIEIIEERKRIDEERNRQLIDLYEKVDASLEDLFDFTLDASMKISNSGFAFSGLVNADESEMIIHRWSRGAMESCSVGGAPIHFPLAAAGLWGDCIRERKPVIVNDYEMETRPTKHGVPEGHVAIRNFLCVPVFDGNRIVAVGAVANKPLPYDSADADALNHIYDKIWALYQKQTAEKRLEESEERFSQFFNSMKEGAALLRAVDDGRDFEIVDINHDALSIGEIGREEAIGKSVTSSFPGVVESGIFEVIRGVHRTGRAEALRAQRYKDDRFEAYIDYSVFPLPSGLTAAVFSDVSDQRRTEQELLKSGWKLKTLFISIDEGVCLHSLVYDESGRAVDYLITDVNRAYEEIVGIRRDSAVGKRATEVYGTADAPYLDVYARVVETGETHRMEVYFDPMRRSFRITALPFEENSFATIFSAVNGQ